MSFPTARSLLQSLAWLVLPAAMCNAALLPPAQLTVRTFDYSGLDPAALNRAQNAASAALRQAGILVVWLNCPVASDRAAAAPACDVRGTGAANLELVILPKRMAVKLSGSSKQFGFAILSPGDGFPNRAYIFRHRVMEFAREEMVSWRQLLGPMMAHEIGHLLLGTNSHFPVGIMRAQWRSGEIEGALMGNLAFTPEQSERMRRDVHRRHGVK